MYDYPQQGYGGVQQSQDMSGGGVSGMQMGQQYSNMQQHLQQQQGPAGDLGGGGARGGYLQPPQYHCGDYQGMMGGSGGGNMYAQRPQNTLNTNCNS